MDLSSLSLAELRRLQTKVETEIRRRSDTAKKDLLKRMQKLAAEHGMSLNEVIGQEAEPDRRQHRDQQRQQRPHRHDAPLARRRAGQPRCGTARRIGWPPRHPGGREGQACQTDHAASPPVETPVSSANSSNAADVAGRAVEVATQTNTTAAKPRTPNRASGSRAVMISSDRMMFWLMMCRPRRAWSNARGSSRRSWPVKATSADSIAASEPVAGDLVCVTGYSLAVASTREPLLEWLATLASGVSVVLDPGDAVDCVVTTNTAGVRWFRLAFAATRPI